MQSIPTVQLITCMTHCYAEKSCLVQLIVAISIVTRMKRSLLVFSLLAAKIPRTLSALNLKSKNTNLIAKYVRRQYFRYLR